MMKHLNNTLIAIAIVFAASPLFGQGFHNGDMLIGPHIGFSGYRAPDFGANLEMGIADSCKILPLPGGIGISGRVDYFGFSEGDWNYTWIDFGVFANYHFPMSDSKWDPFLGIGLGYENIISSWTGEGSSYGYSPSWGSGLYFAGDVGARYFLSSTFDLRAQAGFGSAWLVVGVDFKINSPSPKSQVAIITQ